MVRSNSKPLFSGMSVSEVIRVRIGKTTEEVNNLNSTMMEARGTPVITNELFDKCRLRVPVIDRNGIKILAHGEEDVEAGRSYDSRHGGATVKGSYVIFEAPFVGDYSLFFCQPSQSPLGGIGGFEVNRQSLTFRWSQAGRDPEIHKAAFLNALAEVDKCLETLRKDAADSDRTIRQAIEHALKQRTNELAEYRDMIQGIGFPLKQQNR